MIVKTVRTVYAFDADNFTISCGQIANPVRTVFTGNQDRIHSTSALYA